MNDENWLLRIPFYSMPEPEEDEQLFREQIRGAHADRARSRRKIARKPERRERGSGSRGPESEVREPNTREAVTFQETARVIRVEGNSFVLGLENGEEVTAKSYKGTHSGNPKSTLVAVGDNVRITNGDRGYLIEEVLPRRTKLSRRSAGSKTPFEQVIIANVDLLVIVASVHEPKLRSGIIDRYIVAALDGNLDTALAINKVDLASPDELDEALYFRDLYRGIGYPVYLVSATDGAGITQLRDEIAGKTSVFAGHSGVGKSSIVNAILGEEIAQTGALQKKFRRGAHTTSATTLLEVPTHPNPLPKAEGNLPTYIADSPGVREFANFELDPGNMKFAFVEFLKFQEHCAIPNCSHIHEPGCQVRLAVEEDKISIDRYSSYQKLFDEAKREETKRIRNQ